MFLSLLGLVRILGFRHARGFGACLGELQFRFSLRERRRCVQDLAGLLGRDARDPTVTALMRLAYRCNTAAVLEVASLFASPQAAALIDARCAVNGLDQIEQARAAGRGAILLGSHSGNVVLLALQLAAQGLPVSVVYKQSRMMSARFFEQGFAHYGVDGILANEGIKAYGRMLGALRKNGLVLVMADQGVKRAEDGVPMRFLGKDMPMPAGPAQLARHSGAPVLPVATLTAEPLWRFAIEAPAPRVPGRSLEEDAAALMRLTEAQILRAPQCWSWPHRRWRKFPLAGS